VEPFGHEGGSAVEDAPAHDSDGTGVEVDAWAEAFAESSLLARPTSASVAVPAPSGAPR
jgi:hypothetical protein